MFSFDTPIFMNLITDQSFSVLNIYSIAEKLLKCFMRVLDIFIVFLIPKTTKCWEFFSIGQFKKGMPNSHLCLEVHCTFELILIFGHLFACAERNFARIIDCCN